MQIQQPSLAQVYGIGNDICDVRRIDLVLQKHGERFLQRILGPHERVIFQARKARSEARGVRFVATRFSAKEAFSKAIGLGLRMPMTWRDCEILNHPSGQPFVLLHRQLKTWCEVRHLQAQVTVSDETDYAISQVLVIQAPALNSHIE
jgi:holo-[acyl-carrier protein] synthase